MTCQRSLIANVLGVVLGGLVLFVLVTIAVLAVRGEDEARPTVADLVAAPTTLPGAAAPTTTPTLEKSLGIERLPVRWTPVGQLIDFSQAREVEDASAALRAVYIGEMEGETRQVYTTRRQILSIDWEQDGVVLGFETKRTAPSKLPDGELTFVWRGRTTISAAGGAVDVLDLVPRSTLGVAPESDSEARSLAVGLTGGSQTLVAYRTTSLALPPLSGRVSEIEAVYIVDRWGEGRKLEGITDISSVRWFPNGKAVVAEHDQSDWAHPTQYLIPTEDGQALAVPARHVFVEGTQGGDSGDGSRAAFRLENPSRGARDAYVGVYDSESRELRIIGPGFTADTVWWPADSDRFVVGGEIVDATTGERQPGSLDDIRPPSKSRWDVVSPDGRYLASIVSDPPPPGWRETAECEGLPFRLTLKDVSSGQSKTLMQCEGGHPGAVAWLNERQLVVHIGTCWACDGGGSSNVLLFNVETGQARSLTDGLEKHARFRVSPDGTKVLVDGDTLRVYDTEGRVIKDFGSPPAGFKFEGLAWSPDSASVAFALGPEGWPYWP